MKHCGNPMAGRWLELAQLLLKVLNNYFGVFDAGVDVLDYFTIGNPRASRFKLLAEA